MNCCIQNIAEADAMLVSKPLYAVSAERILILNEIKSEYPDLPQPLRFAKLLSILLERVSVPLEPYDRIAGRCVDRELSDAEEAIFQALRLHPDYPYKDVFLGSGHCTYSWDMVVRLGLPGMEQCVKTKLSQCTDPEKRNFMTAILQIYSALRAYMLRYAEAAAKRGMIEMAQNLRTAAEKRPDSFASALQLLWIITLIDCAYITPNPTLTVGRLDQILFPLYQADLNKGVLTRETAAAYITDYYCKHNLIMGRGEHQVGDETNSTTFSRIFNFDAPQYLLLAGSDESGKPAANELTLLFAECIHPTFKNPVVVVRYVKNMDRLYPELWRVLTEKALQSSSLMFYNDDNVLSTFARMGLPPEDYRAYAHFGCNWASPGDRGMWMALGPKARRFHAYQSAEERAFFEKDQPTSATRHRLPEDFMIVLRNLAERDSGSVTIEDIYRDFFDRMADAIDQKLHYLSKELEVRKRRPAALLTFGDCFLTDSIHKAECCSAGAKYHFELQSFEMFGTVADCFIAVDQLVMIEKKLTLRQLLDAVDADFVGYEQILALCRGADKYGMDTPLSNAHAKRLSETASRLVIEKSRPYLEKEGLFLEPCMQCDTWHLKLGETFSATPDGRRAHTPFSQNIRPSNGACVNGLTAMLNAILQLPCDGLLSGALNLDIDPKQFVGDSGRQTFGALLAAYLNCGGLHAQISCVNVEELMDAQIHPERHRDLRVRVTGYSGVFVDICKRLQDDIIARFQAI